MPIDKQGVIWVHANNEGANMDTLVASKLCSTFGFIQAMADEHMRTNGVPIRGFILPKVLFDRLAKEQGWQQSAFTYMGYIGKFTVISTISAVATMLGEGSSYQWEVLP